MVGLAMCLAGSITEYRMSDRPCAGQLDRAKNAAYVPCLARRTPPRRPRGRTDFHWGHWTW
eukprot:7398518-Pyramimonas_sp.AAC.1